MKEFANRTPAEQYPMHTPELAADQQPMRSGIELDNEPGLEGVVNEVGRVATIFLDGRRTAQRHQESLQQAIDELERAKLSASEDEQRNEKNMIAAFADGRDAAWAKMPKDEGSNYATGVHALTAAIALSPPDEQVEAPEAREARTQILLGISDKIKAGELVAVEYTNYGDNDESSAVGFRPHKAWHTGVAQHDGFGIMLTEDKTSENAFQLTLNGKKITSVHDAAVPLPIETDTDTPIYNTIAVRTGVEAAMYLQTGILEASYAVLDATTHLTDMQEVRSNRNTLDLAATQDIAGGFEAVREAQRGLLTLAKATYDIGQDIHTTPETKERIKEQLRNFVETSVVGDGIQDDEIITAIQVLYHLSKKA
jgi:hypothetical protein